MMKKSENKVAIISDGAGGIGRTTANLFSENGAKVVWVGLEEKSLKDAVAELGIQGFVNKKLIRVRNLNAQPQVEGVQ